MKQSSMQFLQSNGGDEDPRALGGVAKATFRPLPEHQASAGRVQPRVRQAGDTAGAIAGTGASQQAGTPREITCCRFSAKLELHQQHCAHKCTDVFKWL